LERKLLKLWDKAVGLEGYDKREWEELRRGMDEIALMGLGTPSSGVDEFHNTPVELEDGGRRRSRFVQVVEMSNDGRTWHEVLRAPLGQALDCDDLCGSRQGERLIRVIAAEPRRKKG
jgi:hypothetical protein